MIKILFNAVKNVVGGLTSINKIELNKRNNEFEIIGETNGKNVIVTIQVKEYIPLDKFGERGQLRKTVHHKTIDNRNSIKRVKDIPTEVYDMTVAEKSFINNAYTRYHLTQKQISSVSGIPQEVVNRYIKRNKLKPMYSNSTAKKERFIKYTSKEIDYELEKITHQSNDLNQNYRCNNESIFKLTKN